MRTSQFIAISYSICPKYVSDEKSVRLITDCCKQASEGNTDQIWKAVYSPE